MKPVLVDVDDTIAETQRLLIEHINAELGAEYKFEEMDRRYREDLDDDTRQWTEAVWAALKKPDLMQTMAPSDNALEAMEVLVENEFVPHIVTARKKLLFEPTKKWLKQHGFHRYYELMHPRRDGESGVEFKLRVAREVGFVAGFDDTYEVVVALSEVIPTMYLIDKPWNNGDDCPLPSNVVRVASFSHGAQHLLNNQNHMML
jgi:uncharacterized HAD superfamily protein